MTTELWVDLWTRPGDPNFGRRRDYLPFRSAGAHVGINRVGEGNLELPDSFAGFDDILKTDSDTPANSQSSLVRIYSAEDPTTPIAEWLPAEIFPGGDKDNPYTSVTGIGINGILGYARTEAWDWDGSDDWVPSFPDWIYGGDNLLGNPGFENSVCRPEVNEVTIDRSVVTGGTFTLSDGTDTTSGIAWDAGAATVEMRIEADLGLVDDVLVQGSGGVGDPYVIEFVDPCTFAGGLTFDGSGLTPSAGDSGLDRTQFGALQPNPWTKSQTVSRGVPKVFGAYDNFRVTQAQAHSGDWSLLINPATITSTADRFTGTQQLLSVQENGLYQASIWFYPTNANDVFRLVIRGIDNDLVQTESGGDALVQGTGTANTWNEFVISDIDVGDRDQVIFRFANINNPNLGHPSDPSTFYVDDGEFKEGRAPDTIGKILGDLYDDAVTDHAADGRVVWEIGSTGNPYLTLDFTDTVDSNGNAWADAEISTRITMRQSYSQVMANLANEYGYEYRVVPNDAEAGTWLWQVFNPGGMDDAPDVAVQGGASDTRRQFRRQAPSGTDQMVEGLGRITSRARNTALMSALGRIEASELSREATEISSVSSAAGRAVVESLQDISSVAYTLIDPQDEPMSKYTIGDTVTIVDPPDITAADKRFVDLEVSITGNVVEWECSYGALVVTNADAAVADAVSGLLTKFEYPEYEQPGSITLGGGGGGAPTVVIAASDSHDISKEKADFQCTGVNDHQTIQAAVDLLASGVGSSISHMGRILFCEGFYDMGDTVEVGSNITLQGMGMDATEISGEADLMFDIATTCQIREMTISNFQTGGGCIEVTSGLTVVSNCRIESFDTTGYGINKAAGSDLYVTGCYFDGDGDGIITDSGDGDLLRVVGNVITGCNRGIFCAGTGLSSEIIVMANIIRSNDDWGVELANAELVIVSGNDFNSNGLTANGHLLVAGSDAIISANTFAFSRNGHSCEVTADDCSITGNHFQSSGTNQSNTFDHLNISGDRNFATANQFLADADTRYAVNVGGDCNKVVGNAGGDPASFGTGAVNDAGTNTALVYPNDPVVGDNLFGCDASS